MRCMKGWALYPYSPVSLGATRWKAHSLRLASRQPMPEAGKGECTAACDEAHHCVTQTHCVHENRSLEFEAIFCVLSDDMWF